MISRLCMNSSICSSNSNAGTGTSNGEVTTQVEHSMDDLYIGTY